MFRNDNRKIMQYIRIYKEWTSHKNKEVKPIELVQMNMVLKFYLKDVNWLHISVETRVQDMQQM